MIPARDEGNGAQDDATDDIMDRLVQSVTQNPSDRQSSPKNRKRSRVNRKSCEYGGGFQVRLAGGGMASRVTV